MKPRISIFTFYEVWLSKANAMNLTDEEKERSLRAIAEYNMLNASEQAVFDYVRKCIDARRDYCTMFGENAGKKFDELCRDVQKGYYKRIEFINPSGNVTVIEP